MLKPKRYYLGKFFYFLKNKLPSIYKFLTKNFILSLLLKSWINFYLNFLEVKEVKNTKGKAETIEPIITKE